MQLSLQWCHNGCDGVSNYKPHDRLLNRLFRRRSKKASTLRVTDPWTGNSPVTGEFSAQTASGAENVSIWWRHHISPWYATGTQMMFFALGLYSQEHWHVPRGGHSLCVHLGILSQVLNWSPETGRYIDLTHWSRGTHICVSKLTTIGSDNGLSPGRRQAIIWNNAGILLIRTLGTNFGEILGEIHSFSFSEMHLKMTSAKWRLFGLGLNELIEPVRAVQLPYFLLIWYNLIYVSKIYARGLYLLVLLFNYTPIWNFKGDKNLQLWSSVIEKWSSIINSWNAITQLWSPWFEL